MMQTDDQRTTTPNEAPPKDRSKTADLSARISEASPEGVPANPKLGARGIGLILVAAIVLIMFAAVLLAIFLDPTAGIVLAIVGVLVFMFNPDTWAAIFRAKERSDVNGR